MKKITLETIPSRLKYNICTYGSLKFVFILQLTIEKKVYQTCQNWLRSVVLLITSSYMYTDVGCPFLAFASRAPTWKVFAAVPHARHVHIDLLPGFYYLKKT